MRDPENMTHDEKLATIFGVGGADPLPWNLGMEYRPRPSSGPSSTLVWYLAVVSLLLFPVALVAVPLAVHTARRGSRSAWLAAVCAAGSAVVSVAVLFRGSFG